jgi:hypothetical protein
MAEVMGFRPCFTLCLTTETVLAVGVDSGVLLVSVEDGEVLSQINTDRCVTSLAWTSV